LQIAAQAQGDGAAEGSGGQMNAAVYNGAGGLFGFAGGLAREGRVPVTVGTMPTHGPMFALLLVGIIMIVTALTFFPALSLGPIAEHFLMQAGVVFR